MEIAKPIKGLGEIELTVIGNERMKGNENAVNGVYPYS